MSPLVSVVVPVFNGMPYLPVLVESLVVQDYPNLEFVFTEGGGSDGSEAFLRALPDPRVRVLSMPPGTTAAENWTAACLAATGDYSKLVCQDDLLAEGAISRQVADLEGSPNAVMSIGPRDIVDARGAVLYAKRGCQGLSAGTNPGRDVIHCCYLRGTNVIGEPLTVLFRRDALLGSLPWDDSNPLMLDVSMYAKVAPLGEIIVGTESLGAFRVSTSSWSTRLAKVQRQQFAQWQQEYAASLADPPSSLERARAWVGMEKQALLRRAAYRVLRLKGAFRSAEAISADR